MRAMLVRDIGETRLIDLLHHTLRESGAEKAGGPSRLRLSIGDDAAAWDASAATTVLTCDALVEGVHFDLSRTGWRDLGWKAVAVNLSDVAAMGATPLYTVVTLGLRGDLPIGGVEELYRGMAEATSRFGGTIVGGDVTTSETLFISIAMTGAVPEGALLTRHTATQGDQVAVTGLLGSSAAGLRLLDDEASQDGDVSRFKAAHLRPTPRVDEGAALARLGVTTAMDVSDGLVEDLNKLCVASDVGATVYADQVPIDPALQRLFPDEWRDLALGGGEDYELLFTAPNEVISEVAETLEVPTTVVGEIAAEPKGARVLDADGNAVEIGSTGWEHFRRG